MRYLLIIIFGFIMQSCCSKNDKRDYDLFDQYSFLLLKTYEYLEEDDSKEFLNNLNEFIKNNKDYNFNNGRLEYIICHPLLFNSKKDRILVLVLERTLDKGKKRVEYFQFITALLINNKWSYKLNKVYTKSFGYYYEETPTFSDQELTLRVLKRIIETGYMKIGTLEINDSFFENDDNFIAD